MRAKATGFPKRKIVRVLKLIFGFLALLGFVAAGYYYLITSGYFNVQTYLVTGTAAFVNQNDLREVLSSQSYGQNIFSVNTVKIQDNLLATFRGAKQIIIAKNMPDTLHVTVVERIPLALVYNESSKMFMIDDDGYILGIVQQEHTNLPKIHYEGEIKVGQFIDKSLVPVYLELTSALEKENITATSMSFYPKYTVIYLSGDIESILSNEKNAPESVKNLGLILKQIGLDGEKARKIDLRYDKVIVSYE